MNYYNRFPLFQSHLDLAHNYWSKVVKTGDTVIDATCGNGHDTLILAKLALNDEKGELIAIDVQPQAIESTKTRLATELPELILGRIRFVAGCHSQFPGDIEKESVALIVYNLGYLPGGDKTVTTTCPNTLQSLEAALPLIGIGGMISITCYPGHSEGKREEEMLIEFSRTLDPRLWSCCLHSWINRQASPSLLVCQKKM